MLGEACASLLSDQSLRILAAATLVPFLPLAVDRPRGDFLDTLGA